jgi:putative tryptophan/tyrosine transport system substrate-binding protein
VFKRVRRESPASYLKVCAMLVPREVKLEHSTSAIKAMTDEQIEQAIEVIQTMLAARAGDQAKVIEAVSEPVALPAPSRKPRRKRGAEAKASARSRHRGGNEARVMVFRQALQALGWTEGRNVQFIYRWSAGEVTHARPFAKELVDLRSDVILANSTPVAVAVRDTTRTTPTVFVQVSDPVTAGVVQSLERPGGNLTGFTSFEPSIASKWLELVKRVAPNITRVAYLFNPSTAPLFYARAVEGAAPLLSIKPFAAAVHDADEMEPVIEQFARESDSALLVLPDLFTATNRHSIIALATRHRLPAIYPARYFVAGGGLMSYGIELLETYRQAASYVDRIFKGERPSDLPVQQPTKYELVINLKTAKMLGIEVPPTLLARADEVIE